MNIPANCLNRVFNAHQKEYEQKAIEVLRSGYYVMGKELAAFEREFAAYHGRGECVGLASGLDALWIALRLLGVGAGDEVIVQSNAYIATVMAITINSASPVFVEPEAGFAMTADAVKKKITPKTKAVMVTHLYGMMTPMAELVSLCRDLGLFLVEDCAQAHGAGEYGRKAGTFGTVGCFSFYPTKNLGAFGDGGAIYTCDAALAEKFRIFRNYGSEKKYFNCVVGTNSRLDEFQAALLRVKLKYLDAMNKEKQAIAARYSAEITNPLITPPKPAANTHPVWHQYVIRCERRDMLRAHLRSRGVGTDVHYPIPPHLSEAYRYLGLSRGSLPIAEHLADTVLSIPSYIGLTAEEQTQVIGALNTFR